MQPKEFMQPKELFKLKFIEPDFTSGSKVVFFDAIPKNYSRTNSVVMPFRGMLFDSRSEVVQPKKRLYVVFEAQLGNNLFQHASLIGLSIMTGREPYFILRNSYWHQSGTELLNISALVPIMSSVSLDNVTRIREKRPMTYDQELASDIANIPNDVLMCCYFHSWKYFIHVGDELRAKILANMYPDKLAKADDDIKKYVSKVFPHINRNDAQWKEITIIGVHVRRGDKLKIPGYNIAPKSYFENGMDFFRRRYNKTIFIIASQDHRWSRANIKGDDVVHTDGYGSAAQDMTFVVYMLYMNLILIKHLSHLD